MDLNPEKTLKVETALNDPNPVLFCSQDGSPITFHLETGSGKDEKKTITAVRKVLPVYGGKYVDEYGDMTPYTVLLVTDEGFKKRKYSRPAVCITYVGDCIDENSLLDINEYLHPWEDQLKWRHLNLFNVVYFFNEKFPVFETPKKRKGPDVCRSAASVTSKSLMSVTPLLSPLLTDDPLDEGLEVVRTDPREKGANSKEKSTSPVRKRGASPSREFFAVGEERAASPLEKVSSSVNLPPACSPPVNVPAGAKVVPSCSGLGPVRSRSSRSPTPEPLSDTDYGSVDLDDTLPGDRLRRGRGAQDRYKTWEQHTILRYLVENNKYRNLKGVTVWKEMARKKILPHRPWQSLKNQFLKNILKHLDDYSYLTEEQRNNFRKPPAESSDDDDDSFFCARDYNRKHPVASGNSVHNFIVNRARLISKTQASFPKK